MPRKSLIVTRIAELEVGQVAQFPIEKMQCVRVIASNYGAIKKRKYSTFRDKTNPNHYSVIRLS